MQKIIEDTELGTVVLRKYRFSRGYTIRLKQGKITVSLPLHGSYRHAVELLNLYRESLIAKMKEVPANITSGYDENVLRKQAQAYLPGRLQMLALQFGFVYESLKINKSRGRWGSCSSKKTINLSLYLMILPEHLIDYVLLHELCHTRIMNHSPRFWSLMNEVTNNHAKLLRKELQILTNGK